MNTLHRFLISGLLTGLSLVYACSAYAEQPYQQPSQQPAYSDQVGNKALNGLTNMTTFWLEVPKSVIKESNVEGGNIVYGIIGGLFEGGLHAGFRASTGIIDLFTAPIPTKPIIQPQYIWEDFDETNSYGNVFRLDNNGQPPHYGPPGQTDSNPKYKTSQQATPGYMH